jgi:hypothetical protein
MWQSMCILSGHQNQSTAETVLGALIGAIAGHGKGADPGS